MKNVESLTRLLDQVNGSMVEAKRERFWKGASTTGLFTLTGDKKEGKEKKGRKILECSTMSFFYLIPCFELSLL